MKKVIFNDVRNRVNETNTSTKSIGKTTFLMTIDFCIGGKDYVEKLKNVIKNVGDHKINFAIKFDDKLFCFNKASSSTEFMTICNKHYKKSPT